MTSSETHFQKFWKLKLTNKIRASTFGLYRHEKNVQNYVTLRIHYFRSIRHRGTRNNEYGGAAHGKKSSAMPRSEGLAGNGDHKPIWVTSASAFGCNTRALVLKRDKQNNE